MVVITIITIYMNNKVSLELRPEPTLVSLLQQIQRPASRDCPQGLQLSSQRWVPTMFPLLTCLQFPTSPVTSCDLSPLCTSNRNPINIFYVSPGWCGSADWVPASKPKGHWFSSSQDMCLGCRPGPQMGVKERQLVSHTSMFLSTSFSLSFSLPPLLFESK